MRVIRAIVTYRKLSGGSRSKKCAKNFSKVYSVLESERKIGKISFRANLG